MQSVSALIAEALFAPLGVEKNVRAGMAKGKNELLFLSSLPKKSFSTFSLPWFFFFLLVVAITLLSPCRSYSLTCPPGPGTITQADARGYVRGSLDIIDGTDAILDIALAEGSSLSGGPLLDLVKLLMRADEVSCGFSTVQYHQAVNVALGYAADFALSGTVAGGVLSSVTSIAGLATLPIQWGLDNFQDSTIESAWNNQTTLYIYARTLGYSHQFILNGVSDDTILFTDDGWLYIVSDKQIPSYGAVRPGNYPRENVYGAAQQEYTTWLAKAALSRDREAVANELRNKMQPTISMTPAEPYAPVDITFGVSGHLLGEINIVAYDWTFGDGQSGSGAPVTHYYRNSGNYTVTLTMTDDQGGTHSVTRSVAVSPPPIYVTSPNGCGDESLERSFSTLSSTQFKQYSWNYGDGTPAETGRTQTHTYSTTGYYTVTLTLTLNDNSTITNQSGIFVGPGTRYLQSHTIYGNETWCGGGTYIVQGTITVAQGARLTIEPGVVVKFANQQGITVNGTLDAKGTADNKIVFTSVLDNTYGGDTDSFSQYPDHPEPEDTWQLCPECVGDGSCGRAANYWGQIAFGPTSVNSVIDEAIILYGGSFRSGTWCYNPFATGTFSIKSSSVEVTNSTVSHSWGNGIDIAASPLITGDTISNNGGDGINTSGLSYPVIAGELTTGNGGWGIRCFADSTSSFTGNTVSSNGMGGISCSSSELSGNIIADNQGPAIVQDASGAWGLHSANTISGNTFDGVTITGGTVSRDTTLTANSAVYYIGNTVTISEGTKLTIEPGVVVKFANQQGITVNGTLDAKGTADNKIVFTSVLDNTYGGDTDSFSQYPDHPEPEDTWQLCPECVGDGSCGRAANYWGQIAFGPTSVNSVIDEAIILYGGSFRSGTWCYNPFATGMISIQSSSTDVTNSTVSHSWGNGIDVSNASPLITGDTISGNGGRGVSLGGNGSAPVITGGTISNNGQDGIYSSSSPVIEGELITGNGGWGIACSGSPNPSITGNTVSTNGAGGIFCTSSALNENTITGNTGPAIQQDASGVWANGTNIMSDNTYDGVAITGGTFSRNTTFTANGALYLIGNTVAVAEGVKLAIEPGVVVKFANQQGITVNGTLDAKGTADNKIVFTSVLDNTYGGDTDSFSQYPDHPEPEDTWQLCPECVGDGSCGRAANYWGQIAFGPTSVNSVIDEAIILYGGSFRSGTWCYNPYATGMISIQSSSTDVTNSTVSHSWGNGIDVSNASPLITGDTISENMSYGLFYSGSSLLDATINDWGDPSGPLDTSDDRATGGLYNPGGLGNKVSDHVNYAPWIGMAVDYTVSATVGSGGTAAPSSRTVTTHGATTSFTVTPETGYTTDSTIGGTCPAGSWNGDIYTTGPISGDCSVSFSFTVKTYTVTPSAGAHGAMTPAMPQTVNHGETTAFTLTPEANYHIDTVSGCGGTLVADTYTTGPVTEDCSVTATFTIDTHTVTPGAGVHGAIAPTVPQTVNHGETTSFTLTPEANYHVATVTGCNGTLLGSTFTTGTVIEDCTVTATFAIDTHTVTPLAGEHGTLSPAVAQTVDHGKSISFTLTPETSYHVDTVTGCGGTLAGDTYTTGPVTGDCAITATFALDSYTLNIALAGPGRGTVSAAPVGINCPGDCEEQYDAAATVTLTATPDSRSQFRGWHGDCEGTETTCTVTMDQAKEVTAEFYAFPWTLYLPNILNNGMSRQ